MASGNTATSLLSSVMKGAFMMRDISTGTRHVHMGSSICFIVVLLCRPHPGLAITAYDGSPVKTFRPPIHVPGKRQYITGMQITTLTMGFAVGMTYAWSLSKYIFSMHVFAVYD